MPDLTFDQALAELLDFETPTVEDLRDLVAHTSVQQLDSSIAAEITVLYSGPLALNFHEDGKALSTGNVAVAMAEADPRIKIIDNTHVAKLLNSDEFLDSYIRATGSENLDALFSPSEGFWANASERFASTAKEGDFFVIAPKPSSFGPGLSLDGGIFSRNELKTLLEGDGGGRINGIELSALRERYNALKAADPTAALRDVTELLSVKSMGDIWSNLEVGADSLGNVTIRADADLFTGLGISNFGEVRSSGFATSSAWAGNALFATDGMFNDLDMARVISKSAALKALATAGKIAGPVGDFIELAALTGTVVGLLNAGDRNGAARAAATGLASIGGGALAASAAATYAAPLLAGGPLGWVAYTIVVVGAGVIGSEAGQYVVDKAYTAFSETLPNYYQKTGFNPPVWIADGLGAFHSFVTQTFSDGFNYGARFTRELMNGEIDIVKWFTSDSPTPDVPEIIVTANRRTGQTSVSNLPDFLRGDPLVAQELGQLLLDFARSGGDFQGGSSDGGGNWAGYTQPSTLAQARMQSSVPQRQNIIPILRRNDDGTVTIGAMGSEAPGAEGANGLWINNDAIARIMGTDGRGGFQIRDDITGSLINLKVETVNGEVQTRKLMQQDYSGDLEVRTEYEEDGRTIKNTSLRFGNNPDMIMFTDAAALLGDNLGYRLAKGDKLTGVLYSAVLKTLGQNLGEALDAVAFGSPANIGKNIDAALSDLDSELLANLKSAGLGAVSSFLTAELVNAIGLGGFAGEFSNTAAGAVIGQIATNLTNIGVKFFENGVEKTTTALSHIDLAMVGSAVGSFLGTKLASEIHTFDTIGGQIGSAVGATLGVIAAKELGLYGAIIGGPLGAVIGAAIGAFVGYFFGGLIGSIFGGTPRSGADVSWDEASGKFAITNVYSKKGGSKDAAKSMASAVADTFNGVLAATGGKLTNAQAVQSGNYGMRKGDLVYRPTSTRDTDAISFRLSSKGENAMGRMIGYGVYQGLTDHDFQIMGGNVYVKRAIYNTFELAQNDAANFDTSILFGNIASAQSYASYLANAGVINALVAAEPDSVFALETLINLTRATELGLTRRHASDWYGGFSYLLKEAATSTADVTFGFDYDPTSGQVSRLIGVGDYVMGDAIDIAGQTTIETGAASDVIDLRSGKGTDGKDIAVAATVDGGDGNDTIYASNLGDNLFGGAGNDTLYGGRLDDWLLGGDGDDILDAGTADPLALGGDGNYLNGGAGNDVLRGREGSDWLEGGDGVDTITGGAGDDILSGGAGDGDDLKGGLGNDQYLIRLGDGADIAEDDATGAPVAQGAGDAITQRLAKIEAWKANPLAAGAIRPDWLGAPAGVQQGAVSGGEDAVVFGTGIGIGDIRMQRSGTSGAPGNDLIIQVMQTDPNTGAESFSGTQLTIKDWFSNPFKRVEWLKFADGNEIRIGDVTSFIVGGSGDDVLIGTAGNDFVYGGAGDDKLFLLGGDDIGNGASGNDMVAGDAGRDLLIGGTGSDTLIGGAGADALSGDAGADDLYGGADRDILSGGRGDGDIVVGGAGDDTFKFARGDGRDIYFDEYANYWSVVWSSAGDWNTAAGFNYDPATGIVTGPGGAILRQNFGTAEKPDFQWVGRYDYDAATGTLKVFNPPAGVAITANAGVDTIEFAPGINLQDVILRRSGDDLVMAVSRDDLEVADLGAVTDSVTIKDWYTSPGQIEKLAFYATGILDIAPGTTNLVAGTDGADGTLTTPLAGSVVADWITAGAGDDVVAGGSGNDIIAGNSGSDTLRGESGDDVLYGGTGNDILDGGSGKDILVGGSGVDTASYASAAAAVRVRLSAQSNNLGDAAGDEYDSIENVIGGAAADDIGGDEGDNELDGGSGADLLMGGAGDDTYIWSPTSGADTVREGDFTVEEAVTTAGVLADDYTATWTNTGTPSSGGKYYWRLEIRGPGNELVYDYAQYSYAAGTAMPAPAAWNSAGWLGGFAKTNGQQVTRDKFDTSISGGDQDAIEFTAGISLTDLTFIRASGGAPNATGPDLIIRYGGSAATQLTVKDHFTVYGRVETLQFNDGLAVSLESILVAISGAALNGTANADLIVGQTGVAADLLYGGAGDDVLSGLEGDDELYGDDGDDVLEGGAGADRLDGGANAVDGRGDTVRYVKSAAVTIDLGKTTAQGGGDAEGDTLFGIENVVGSQTGGDTITGDAGANIIDALDGNNIVDGKGGDDVLIAGAGNDILYGGAGEDNLTAGDGDDQLWGGTEDDILVGGAGIDQLRGEDGNDTLLGGDGNDSVLDGGTGDDEIYGEGGNDTLTGGEGNDVLAGGAGNDLLQGGVGDDLYLVQANDGADRIVDAAGTNIISFDKAISYDRLWLTRVGSDLKISVIGDDTVVTVADFFAAVSAGKIRSIQTTTHAIFLDHPDTLNLITAMTTVSATVPASVPSAITDTLDRYWHEGGKAVPIAPSAPRTVTASEDSAIAIDGNYGVIDHDSNITGYQLKDGAGPAKGVISNFDPATGALTYTPNADANGSDSFIVIITDSDGHAVELPVNVGITAVNDAPRALAIKGGGNLAVAESAPGSLLAAGTIIGEFESSDIEGDSISYSLVGDAGGRFAMTADGKLSVANPSGIDFEAASSHVVRVRATDGNGAFSEQDFTVAVENRNETNSLPASYSMSVAENVAVGTVVGSVAATDLDQAGAFAQQRYYFWNGSATSATSSDGRYAINATTGQITVNGALSFEAASPSKSYQIIARDNAGAAGYNQAVTTVTIGITDVNEANSLPASYSMTVNENVAVGTVVGSVAATDLDNAGTNFAQQRYYFWNGSAASSVSSDGRYEIDVLTGTITTNAALDFEAGTTSVTYQVIARDNAGAAGYIQAQAAVTIGIANLNEANSLPASYSMAVNENVALGAVVGTVAATDLDSASVAFGQQRYYFWDGTAASGTSADGRYAINATTGQITVNAALNFEAGTPSKTYQVIARDNAGAAGYNQTQSAVTIGITDVNEANNLPASYSMMVNENVAVGTVVGTVAATDVDTTGSVFAQQRYYFWNGSAASAVSSDGRYEIDALTGTITTNAALNFEAGTTSVTYQVVARDNAGGAGYIQAQTAVTIGIANLNEANSLPASYSMAVNENVALGTVVGSVSATDIDSAGVAFGQQRYYFWDGTTASATSSDGRYAINQATGQITVNAALNFEAGTPTKIYQVVARDNAGASPYNQVQSAVTIAISDLNEAPTSLNWTPQVANVAERDRIGAGGTRPAIVLGTISVSDPDTAGLQNATYSYAVSDSRFEVVSGVLRLKQDASFDYEAGATVTVTVTGTDATGAPFTINKAISIAVTDVDDVSDGTSAADTIVGQSGRDIINGNGGNDTLSGGAGNDSIDGGDGNDLINGQDGDDTLLGQAGTDTIYGGVGNDTLRGGNDNDRLFGEAGNDLLYGDAGSEGVRAAGTDAWRGFTQAGLVGGDGNDLLDGGTGDDYLDGGAGADQLIGGDGFDGVDYSASNAAVTVNLATGTGSGGHAQGDTLNGIELVQGSAFSDTITGSAGSDVIYGGAGNDLIIGGAGNDYLFGGDGNDTINAEAGDDVLDGGAGDDILNGGIDNDLYIVTRSSGADTINNYDPSGDDIDLIGFNDATGAINDQDLWFERIGDDLKISVIGTTSSVQVTNWYVVTDANGRANHQIDFIVAGTSYSRTLNIEGLVSLMATKTKPATAAARDTLMADLTYKAMWATYWNSNATPTLTAIAQQTTNEDVVKSFSVTATDDITPGTQIQLSAEVISGTNVVTNAGISFGTPNASGVRTMTINPVANASGTARIRVTATDAGGISTSQEFNIVVNAVADTPTITQFTSAGGTSGQAGGIPLTLNVSYPDSDGSETHEIWITGVPSGITLSAGTYDSASSTWKLTQAQLANLKLNAPAGWSADPTLTATARATENGQTAISAVVQLTVSVNAPPTGASLSGSVNENAANATAIGTVVGTDPDGDAMTYSMVDSAGGRFAVSAAGAVTVANGTLLNFETTTSHSITVRITDTRGTYIDRSFTIAVNNVNEANSLPATYSMAVNENSAAGTLVGTVTATDLDSASIAFGQQRYYFLNGTTASATSSDGRYAINATTGQITVNGALNFEAGTTSVSYAVIARDNAGAAGYSQAQSSVTIAINNVNEQNSLPASYSFSVNENTGIGTVVGSVVATDLDVGGAFASQRYYFLNGTTASAISSDGRYTINATTGQITTYAALNYEAGTPSATYTVIARDNAGAGSYTQDQTSVTIGINNLNEANSIAASYSLAVNENVAVGTVVGTIAATDLDSSSVAFGQQRYYFLNGTTASATSSDGRYAINATTGQITTNAALNYEAATPSVTYAVIARDNAGAAGYNQVQSNVTIGINNVNEANSIAASFSFGVNENVAVGTAVGTVAATDLDSSSVAFGQQRYYFLNGTTASATSSDGRYAINATTGQITTNAALNFEAGTPSVAYAVIARDNAGAAGYHQVQSSVTIGINNLNEANSIAASFSFGVNENVAVGTAVGTVVASDIDSTSVAFGQQRYYFLNGTTASATSSDGRYTINATTGQITTNAALNYEIGTPSVAYTVIARDNAGAAGYNQVQSSVTIGINNLNEANSIPASYSFAVNENVAIGTAVGTVAATDLDSSSIAFGQQRYYFWDGTATSANSSDGRYTINATTGQITTKIALNYEAGTPSKPYTVIARDNAGGAGYNEKQSTVTIGIRDLNEANSIPASYSMSVKENMPVGTVVGQVTATDIDSSSVAFGQQRYYFVNGTMASGESSDGRYVINATTGQITTKIALDFDVGTPYGIYTVAARDNAGAAGYNQVQTSVTINLQNIDEPHSMSNKSIDVNERNVAPGPYVAVGSFSGMLSDPENGANISFKFSNGTDTMNGWRIDSASGDVWMVSAMDYEALTSVYELQMVMVGMDPWDYTPIYEEQYVYVGKDPALATFNLGVVAKNTLTGGEAQGTLTINVKDVNEAPVIGSTTGYLAVDQDKDGAVYKKSANEYWVTANRDGSAVIQILPTDPEGTTSFTYSLSNVQAPIEVIGTYGGDSEIEATAYPYISIDSSGRVNFYTPGEEYGEWEGGVKIGGTRRRSSVTINFTVNVSDGVNTTAQQFKIVFVRRDTAAPPIVLDLDGDGLELVPSETSPIEFDMDGDGIKDETGWVGADDGFLALDRNGNGLIDDISEISFIDDAEGALSDLEGLRAYDSDGDGYFDADDAEFGRFLIWQDANQDGVSQATELKTLGEWGITAINLSVTLADAPSGQEGNTIIATSDYEKSDGTTGVVGDVSIGFTPSKIDDIAPPIVLDFDGDGADLVSLADSKTKFDMNGDGIADKTGWIEQGDAFLALDRNGNGKIDDLSEISFVADKAGAKTDLEGLAAFDSNGDGVLSGDDARFAEFRLWFDNNANGVTDAGELLSLAQAGVTSISLTGVATGEEAVAGKNIIYNTGSFTRADGATGKLLDTGLAFKALSALPEIEFQTSNWGERSKAYRLNASGGIARIVPRMPEGELSADAGQIAAAAMISTRSGDYGLLSTILLDLDGDGLEAKRVNKIKARFDMNGDGLRDDTGWVSGGDGMLVIDRDKDGKITHASELSFLSEKEGAKNSWEGLAALDSNKDGKLDKSDARFGELKVWIDGNGDGISQDGEIRTLADLSIAEIGLRNAATSDSVKLGRNLALSTATFKRENGTTATIGNVALGFEAAKLARPSHVAPEGGPLVVPIDAVRAASNLAQAMSRFGIDGAGDGLRNLPNDGMAPHDWFTAAVA